jgi:hypothetical protein
VAVSFENRKRLLRLHGIAEELLASARAAKDDQAAKAVAAQLDVLAGEIRDVLTRSDGELAEEFERVVIDAVKQLPAADVRAAVLVGWLKAGLAAESIDAQRSENAPPRKHSIGFRIRSPITREIQPPQ